MLFHALFLELLFSKWFFRRVFFSCMSACAFVALLCLWVVDVTLFVFAVAVSQTAPTAFNTLWLRKQWLLLLQAALVVLVNHQTTHGVAVGARIFLLHRKRKKKKKKKTKP